MSSLDAYPEPELPPVDARLAEPDTRFEILDGVVSYVAPADAPHGTRHPKLAALLEAHVGPEFDVAVDMLTRVSRTSDIAPDASVFPLARDPRTGGRQLEHLAFELVSTQTLRNAGRKTAQLVARGVRRVFAIDVVRDRAFEWSAALGGWTALDPALRIEDPVFAVSLPVAALLRSAKTDDAVAQALIRKHNPVIEAAVAEGKRAGLMEGKRAGLTEGKRAGLMEGKRAGLTEGKRAGLTEGKRAGLTEGKRAGLTEGKRAGLTEGLLCGRRAAVLDVLAARGIAVAVDERARILAEPDLERLGRWLARAVTCNAACELFEAP
jgi:Uma2 family endonuclease